MTATAGTHNNQSAIGWQKTITASSCNENAFKHRGVTTGSRFTNLTTGSAGKKACFRAYYSAFNGRNDKWGYGSETIEFESTSPATTVKPTISAAQDGKTMTATSNTYGGATAIGWKNAVVGRSTDCENATSSNWINGKNKNLIGTKSQYTNKKVCFKAYFSAFSSKSDKWGYGSENIDLPVFDSTPSPSTTVKPTVTVSQEDKKMKAMSNTHSGATAIGWKNVVVGRSTDCENATSSNWINGKNKNLTGTKSQYTNKKVCFKAYFSAFSSKSDKWGYGSENIDLSVFDSTPSPSTTVKPTVTVNQDGRTVSATANTHNNVGAAGWQNAIVNQSVDCKNADSFEPGSNKSLTGAGSEYTNKKACFRAYFSAFSSRSNKWGYGEKNIDTAVIPETVVQPTLTITQEGRTVSATANKHNDVAAIGWEHAMVNQSADCDDATYSDTGNIENLTEAKSQYTNKKVCFRAYFKAFEGKSDRWGFGGKNVDTGLFPVTVVKPTVTATQAAREMTATANKHNEVDATGWQSAVVGKSTDCDDATSWDDGNTRSLSEAKSQYTDKKVCFRAYFSVFEGQGDRWGYGSQNIDTDLFPSEEIRVTHDGQFIEVEQSNRDLTASRKANLTMAVVDYQYRFLSSGDCDKSQFATSYSTGKTYELQSSDADKVNQIACFRARTVVSSTHHQWAYAFVVVESFNLPTNGGSTTITSSSGQNAAGTGGTGKLTETGILDEGINLPQLAGFVLIAGAILGTVRILLIKKKRYSPSRQVY